MPSPRSRMLTPLILARLALVVLAFSACAAFPGAFSIVPPPTPYYVNNTASSALQVTVSISVDGNSLSYAGGVFAAMSILFSVPGHVIGFRDGETLSCDGGAPSALSLMGSGTYQEYSPAGVGASHPFSCTYTSKGQSATFTVVIPVPPTIITPTERATLLLAPTLTVTYQNLSGPAQLEAISGTDNPRTDAKVKIVDPHQMTIDTRDFVAGAGQINIQDVPPVQVVAAGDFRAFNANCKGTAHIDVTWV